LKYPSWSFLKSAAVVVRLSDSALLSLARVLVRSCSWVSSPLTAVSLAWKRRYSATRATSDSLSRASRPSARVFQFVRVTNAWTLKYIHTTEATSTTKVRILPNQVIVPSPVHAVAVKVRTDLDAVGRPSRADSLLATARRGRPTLISAALAAALVAWFRVP